jgi:hypothetical protein
MEGHDALTHDAVATPCAGAAAALESLRHAASYGGSGALCAGGSDAAAAAEEEDAGGSGGGVGFGGSATAAPVVGEAMLRCLDKTHGEGCSMCVRACARARAAPRRAAHAQALPRRKTCNVRYSFWGVHTSRGAPRRWRARRLRALTRLARAPRPQLHSRAAGQRRE